MYRWPAPPTHGAEGPLPPSPYAEAIRRGGKVVPTAPYDQYSSPSMYMGPVGPVPVAGVWYAPYVLRGIPRGEMGTVDAYRAQGPLPGERPPWRPAPAPTWADVLKKGGGR